MKKLDVGRVLRRLRVEERHLTLYELHEAVGGAINPTTLSRMESHNQTIKIDYLVILGEFYGLSVADIIREAEGGSPADPAIAGACRVPLLGGGDVARWLQPAQRQGLRERRETLIALPPANAHTFALLQSGDSMQSDSGAAFADGTTLLVDPELAPDDRDYVIALPEGGAPMLRQLVREGDDTYLKPLNRNYRPRLIDPGITLAGTVFHASWRRH